MQKEKIEKKLNAKEKSCVFSLHRLSRFIEPSILLFLSKGKCHGYDLIEKLSGLGFHQEDIDVGAVYRALRRLEKDGFIKSNWQSQGARKKRVYRITSQGRALLRSWIDRIEERKKALERFLDIYREVL